MMERSEVSDQDLLARITSSPNIMAGKPVIRGTRLTVEYVLKLLARGATEEQVLSEYDGLTPADIQACFLVASRSLEKSAFLSLPVEAA
jgi:uncharacterized protein (DUF433 family)/predicted nuclease of predicted toxin-antitoxin system